MYARGGAFVGYISSQIKTPVKLIQVAAFVISFKI